MTPDLPPAIYDRPYGGTLVVEMVEPHETNAKCGRAVLGYITQACAFVSAEGKVCRIVFPTDNGVYPKQFIERLWRHEIGHCNGWRH